MIQERKHNRTNFNANKMPLIYVKGCKEKCILMKAAAPTQFKNFIVKSCFIQKINKLYIFRAS
jgi:hypothetical protein